MVAGSWRESQVTGQECKVLQAELKQSVRKTERTQTNKEDKAKEEGHENMNLHKQLICKLEGRRLDGRAMI